MKTCTQCHIEKPLADFPAAKQNRDGRSSWCRQCANDKRKQKYHNDPDHRERMKARTRELYHNDTRYGERTRELARDRSKRLTETGARKNDEQRVKQRRWNKTRNRDTLRSWKRTRHQQRYSTDSEWREKERQRSEQRRKQTYADPQKLARWHIYQRRTMHRRRSILADAGSYTNTEWATLCERYDHRCLCCGERRPLTVDHVIPLSQGGANTIDNLQPLCLSCNDRKGSRTIDYRS